MNPVIENLLARRSTPRLALPVPTNEEMNLVLKCALTAPDHGRLKPWRFVVLQGDALNQLGEAYRAAKETELGELTEAQEQRFLSMPKRAPMMVVALAEYKEHPKVPAIEQAVAVGCAVQNIQLALNSIGYGAMWRTGEFAFNDSVKAHFGVKPTDEIIGFLYVGTSEAAPKEVEAQPLEEAVSFWS